MPTKLALHAPTKKYNEPKAEREARRQQDLLAGNDLTDHALIYAFQAERARAARAYETKGDTMEAFKHECSADVEEAHEELQAAALRYAEACGWRVGPR